LNPIIKPVLDEPVEAPYAYQHTGWFRAKVKVQKVQKISPLLEELGLRLLKLYKEELYNLYTSPSIVIKSRRTRWAEHVARMGDRSMHRGFWWVDLVERATWKAKA
jgi:hypothetical protein